MKKKKIKQVVCIPEDDLIIITEDNTFYRAREMMTGAWIILEMKELNKEIKEKFITTKP